MSARTYAHSLDPLSGMDERSVSRSAVSRRFVALSQQESPLSEFEIDRDFANGEAPQRYERAK